MLSRKRTAGVASFVLAVMLLVQGALAYAGCMGTERAPAQVVSAMQAMPCCADDESDALPGNANLCLAHCTGEAQSVDTAGLPIPAFYGSAVRPILSPPTLPVAAQFLHQAWHALPAPPPTILFQTFRI